tara:strand:+ start:1388 stop:2167 length:780 start_codon:yes stop_codon:yes gene_type:complete
VKAICTAATKCLGAGGPLLPRGALYGLGRTVDDKRVLPVGKRKQLVMTVYAASLEAHTCLCRLFVKGRHQPRIADAISEWCAFGPVGPYACIRHPCPGMHEVNAAILHPRQARHLPVRFGLRRACPVYSGHNVFAGCPGRSRVIVDGACAQCAAVKELPCFAHGLCRHDHPVLEGGLARQTRRQRDRANAAAVDDDAVIGGGHSLRRSQVSVASISEHLSRHTPAPPRAPASPSPVLEHRPERLAKASFPKACMCEARR